MDGHHAWIYSGQSLSDLPDSIAITPGDADTDVLEVAAVTIDDVRRLQMRAATRPVTKTHRLFVIVAASVPTISQNALLKLFEDPPATSKFLLVTPEIDSLLPTLRSRVLVVSSPAVAAATSETHPLLRASYRDRLEAIAAWAKASDTVAMQAFLNAVEGYVHTSVDQHRELTQALIAVRKKFTAPGSSKKMLLEHIALLLPVVR